MAIIKCKMCGGNLKVIDGASTAECEFCGTVQTVPMLDDEKKLIQFERAERLRKQCEFDKAAGIYESIVADFRQEAEAYWGLVLCKFGIEYVDDPTTGKKIPTCHRSSFNSIMEDADFEQALENADVVARRVYREEAKQIEQIRKGIIAVSANEEPYDIFICYKETAENGERTLDSVLAQDIYDALTDKGYRVFFSRITLEEKLGMEYESYIFAALNSASIMLVVGTDYEYFNAVWVKNEWSRFLKLMAKDKNKHLIPCFKGIDAYDMPREFARLQAQDMGKVGAVQDLLRGVEKLMPRQTENVTVVQERLIVGGSTGNKIESLLDRGNMALEDAEWAKADGFFEEVLNNDSKNAQAYIGKALVAEKCRTMDAFVSKRKDASQNARGQLFQLTPDEKHIAGRVEEYQLPGFLEPEQIRRLYAFDLRYYSYVAERQQQYQNEEKYWAEHRLLSRAEKFAADAVADKLANEKKTLFTALSERIEQAKFAETNVKTQLREKYVAHLKQADAQAEQLYQNALANRENHYQQLIHLFKTTMKVHELQETARRFEALDNYRDSVELAKQCRERAAEAQQKLDEAAAQLRLLREQEEKEQKAKAKRKTIITVSIIAFVVITALVLLLVFKVIIPNKQYNSAMEQKNAGNYEEAIEMFTALNGYKDSYAQIIACQTGILEDTYQQAMDLLNAEKFQEAHDLFQSISGYADAADQAQEAKYQEGLYYWDQKDYEKSNQIFTDLGYYKNSQDMIHEHFFDAQREKEPTCVEDGTMVLTCDCGFTTKESIPAVGHSYDDGAVEKAATCTATGVMRYLCHCGESFTETIEKKAHNYNSYVSVAATCEQKGTKTYTCVDCSDSYTESISAIGHNYSKATCTAAAVCANCQQVKQEALGHTTDYGMCDRCGKTSAPTLTFSGTSTYWDEGRHTYTLPKGKYRITITISKGDWDFDFGMDGPGLLFLTSVDGPGTYSEDIELYQNYEGGDIRIRAAGDYTIRISPI